MIVLLGCLASVTPAAKLCTGTELNPVSAEDTAGDYPVPIDALNQLYPADVENLPDHLGGILNGTRARLAVYLYERGQTHERAVRIAATCDSASLRRVARFVGNALYDLSRQNPSTWVEASPSTGHRRKVSLAGSPAAVSR